MSHDLTLPPIPGLARRTTPMIDDYGRRGVVSALTANDWTIALDDIDEQPKRAIGPLPIVGWSVDLANATGRAHAARWLAAKLAPDDGPYLDASVMPGRTIGPTLFGLATTSVYEGQRWRRLRDVSPFEVCDGLDPFLDRRLPDDSRWVDAEALRRVVLHVAGVAG